MGMGTKIELIKAEPWPPENGVIPPPELKWYEKYWKYITVIGAGVGVTAIVLAMKKK